MGPKGTSVSAWRSCGLTVGRTILSVDFQKTDRIVRPTGNLACEANHKRYSLPNAFSRRLLGHPARLANLAKKRRHFLHFLGLFASQIVLLTWILAEIE